MNKIKSRLELFPYQPKHIQGAGWAKISSRKYSLEFPEAHVLFFKKNKIFSAYALDYGQFSEGKTIEESFQNLIEVLHGFFQYAYDNKTDLYSFSAPPEIWSFYRLHAEIGKTKSFFEQKKILRKEKDQKIIISKEKLFILIKKLISQIDENKKNKIVITENENMIKELYEENIKLKSFIKFSRTQTMENNIFDNKEYDEVIVEAAFQKTKEFQDISSWTTN